MSDKAFSRVYNVTAQGVIKATSGILMRVIVQTAGSTAGTFNDCATVGTIAAANQIISIPSTAVAGTVIVLDWPCNTGIVFTPGTSMVVAVAYV